MKTTIAVLALLVVEPVYASDWSETDTAFQAALVAVSLVDWAQTIGFTQHPQCDATRCVYWMEMNPLLGSQPSRTQVNLMIPASILVHTGVAWLLPQPYRRIWQSVGITVELAAVGNNVRNGVSLSLPWN